MTAGSNGTDTPENDDPFGYLYRSEGGEAGAQGTSGAGAAVRQPGVPRRSYNQVRAVGERQYGQQQYGQQAPQQQAYGRQNAHYAAPETLPGGGQRAAGHGAHGAGGSDQGPRRNRNGLLIGAIAVVAVVCVGIGVAMVSNSDEGKNDQAGGTGASASESAEPSSKPSDKPAEADLPKADAGSLRLDGTATTAKDIPGARSSGGLYVTGMNTPGAAATWQLDVPKDGQYTIFVGYGVPGKDADATLSINGKARDSSLNMKNFAGAKEGDWEKGWTRTYAYAQLNKGTNTIKISCEQGNQCDFNLDQVWLKAGQVTQP
ncbi:carbohydrate-binding protein [Streptomyces sp. Ru73]|uniref:CBM35 domain-containing protein n=1 Tax=Streptomyces sp. Ru73 TaxID=2080748 RepID=UPI000CDD50C4|nr:carbohydrate-binding protein [Streptomyces sp. Ru73]POX37256.1 carbohydrate-binding protein [Streptomyces sp. Ru73]